MKLFLIVFILMSITITIMAVGVIFSNKPIKGSCGGLPNILGLKCGICGERKKCQKKKKLNQEL